MFFVQLEHLPNSRGSQCAGRTCYFFFFFFFETLKCARINDTNRVIRNPNILHMRKQRRRSAALKPQLISSFVFVTYILYFLYFLKQTFQPLAIFCGSTARFVSDLVGYHRIQVLAKNLFPHDMFFCSVTTFCLIRNKHIQQNSASLLNTHPYMSRIARNPVFGVFNRVRHKLCCTATEDA